jgi:hypothetical protein
MSIDLGSYNTVADRMREFFDRYPDGCLRPAAPWRVEQIGDKAFVVFEAAAYRTADDPNPGVGTAWEPFPGRTQFTRDSELMNAETSAWGRAILAVGAADTRKGVASAEEVRNRQTPDEPEQERRPTRAAVELFERITAAASEEELRACWQEVNLAGSNGEIAGPETGQLKSHITRRREEFAVAPTEEAPA